MTLSLDTDLTDGDRTLVIVIFFVAIFGGLSLVLYMFFWLLTDCFTAGKFDSYLKAEVQKFKFDKFNSASKSSMKKSSSSIDSGRL